MSKQDEVDICRKCPDLYHEIAELNAKLAIAVSALERAKYVFRASITDSQTWAAYKAEELKVIDALERMGEK